jgi:hypothetical protein
MKRLALGASAFFVFACNAKFPQGLKPRYFCACFGTTKVMPCYKA